MKKMMIILVMVLSFLLIEQNSIAQQDTTKEKPTQYRCGIELKENYQSYEEKYAGKNLNEVKRSLFPLRGGTGVWTELNPKVPRVDYLGIHFVNKDTGWAVGDLGALIKTTNGGDDWTIAETNTTTLLIKVHSYDGQILIATGYDGMILRSSDGGESFEQVQSGVGSGVDLWGLQMLNDTLGFACGLNQTLLKTTDAGLTWQQVNAGLNAHYWALDFLNENYGMIACGDGKVLRTTNGGNNWTEHQAGDASDLFALDIVDSLHIGAAGLNGKNVYSSDGGVTWIQNNRLQHDELNSIKFISTDTGYTVGIYTGESWGIRKTTNRGVSWFSPPIQNLSEWELELLPDGVGYSAGSSLWIMKTTEDYDNWENLFFNIDLADVYFTNELTGYIAGGTWTGGPVYKTTDGGLSWFGLPNFPTGLFTSTLRTLTFTDSVTGFAGGAPFRIVKTTDAGETWRRANIIGVADTLGQISKFFFINPTTGWAVTSFRGTILKTTDAGENWFAQLITAGGYGLTGIYFVDSLFGWVSGGRPFKTTNGGQNWMELSNSTLWNSDDVYFCNYLTGWFISGNELYYTNDGGMNWFIDPQIYTYSRNFETISNAHFIITGTNIYESIDTGQVWENITSEVGSYFTALHAPKIYQAYGVGPLGYIISYLDTSIVPVELINFKAEQTDNKIFLKWSTVTEKNNQGFEILKSIDLYNWNEIGFVEGKGTTTEENQYSFVDNKITATKIYYRLKQIDFNGSFSYSEIITLEVPVNNFYLSQNYPNPANPITNISFTLPQKSRVKINLYSINGELVKQLINEEKEKGIYNIEINLSNLSSGVYFYRMITNTGYQSIKKLIILK